MQVNILGPVTLRHAGREVPIVGARLAALLARLAVDAGPPAPWSLRSSW